MILILRTDKPEAEIGLYDAETKIDYLQWQAHRQLAETLHQQIQDVLARNQKTYKDLTGIVCYQGPGSFTGLRIGLSVANALAYSLHVPIVGATGEGWITQGIARLQSGVRQAVVMPEYGADVHITLPKH